MNALENNVWEIKYRPACVDDTILPADIKKTIKEQVASNHIPNMLLVGPPGCGKTSLSNAISEEIGADVLFINASLDGNIDVLRTKITQFVSSVSFTDSKKIVVLDESDHLNCVPAFQKVMIQDPSRRWNSINVEIGQLVGQTINVVSIENNISTWDEGYVFCSGEAEVYEVEFENFQKMYTTLNHKFFTPEMVETIIKVDEYLFTIFGDTAKITKITPIGILPVFDITTKRTGKFVLSNGVVAHNCNSVMPALRGFMDEFSTNAIFIFTANYPERIIPALQSRLTRIDFKFSKGDIQPAIRDMFLRAMYILNKEKIKFDKPTVLELVKKNFPDFRKTIVSLQQYSSSGQIDSGILANIDNTGFEELVLNLRGKNFTKLRDWVASNPMDSSQFYRMFYDKVSPLLDKSSIPELILQIGEYQFRAAFSVDSEINNMAFLVNFLRSCKFI